jgi:hypothetical protein
MSLKFAAAPSFPANQTQAGGTATTDRVPSQFWANIGRVMIQADPISGDISATFIGLPFGLGLDTMNQTKGSGYLAQAKNGLLDELNAACKDFEAGQEVILGLPDKVPDLKKGQSTMLDGLFIQLRRVNDETSRPASENPFLAAMSTNRLSVVR